METRTLTRLGIITSVGLILFVLESLAPRPLPWMKLGLGNTAVVATLLLFGPLPAMAVGAIKILAGSLVTGTLASPTFVIGGTAGTVSIALMAGLHRAWPGMFSAVGLSVAGAVAHQLSQLAVAFLYVGHGAVLSYVSLFMITGLVSGVVTGAVVHYCLVQIERLDWSAPSD